MKIRELHRWDVTPKEAVGIQERLREKVSNVDSCAEIRLIAGADVSYSRNENSVHAAVGVFSFPELRLIEQQTATVRTTFPYIPGLLTFREGPALIECFIISLMLLSLTGRGSAILEGWGLQATWEFCLISLP